MADLSPRFDDATDLPLSWGLSRVFIRGIVWLVIFVALACLVAVYVYSPEQPLRVAGPSVELLVALATLLLMRRGKIRQALNLLVWATWLVMSVVLFHYGGVRGTLVVFYPVLITVCGWLFGARRALVMATLTAASTLFLLGAEIVGWLPGPTTTPAAIHGLIQVLCIFFSAFVIVFLVRSYGRRLREVEVLSDTLALRTQQAQAIASDLNIAQAVARTGSWVYHFASGTIEMSPEACRIFGVDEGTRATLANYRERVHADDLPALAQAWQAALRGKPLVSEHRSGHGEATRWIRLRGQVELDAAGKPTRCVGTAQDISEIKRAEEELSIAATAFEAQEGMVITDAATRILRVNAAFTRITGYSIADVAGRTPRRLKSGRHERAFYTAMWEQISKHGSWQGEIWNRRKSGEVYPGWLTITAVVNAEGSVTHYVGTLTDITERKAAEDEIKHLAFFDALTGLPNRRLLLDRLQQALAASARSGRQGALLFLDLDHFKLLNDTLGHDKGDLLLQQVAARLTTCIREGDTVSRFGGDEFVVMLVDLSTRVDESAAQADAVGQKILVALNRPYDLDGDVYHSTTSIGVTLFCDHQASAFDLLKEADLALYAAKAAGRNTTRFYHPDMKPAPPPATHVRA